MHLCLKQNAFKDLMPLKFYIFGNPVIIFPSDVLIMILYFYDSRKLCKANKCELVISFCALYMSGI